MHILCLFGQSGDATLSCRESACLFNLASDPCEYTDLSGDSQYEAVYQYMYHMMQAWFNQQQTALYLEFTSADTKCDPSFHGGYWQPWLRDYSHDDELEDFEDVLSKYAMQNGLTEDIHSDSYYAAAQGFKVQWQEQQQRERQVEHGKGKKSNMDETMMWVMIGIITLLLMAVFISNKICKTGHIAKRWRQSSVDVRAQFDEDEYSPLVH